MNKKIIIVLLMLVSFAFSGCSGSKDENVSTGLPAAKKPVVQKVKPAAPSEEEQKTGYEVQGTRDPFQAYEIIKLDDYSRMGTDEILQNVTLGQIALTGVILGNDPKALVQDASGTGYIIKEGMHVGENSGIVTKINKDGVTIKQHFKDYMGKVNTREVVLTLKKEEGEK